MKLIFIVLLFSFTALASDLKVKVECGASSSCQNYKKLYKKLLSNKSENYVVLTKLFLKEGGILAPKIIKNNNEITLSFKIKPILSEITLDTSQNINMDVVNRMINIYTGEIYDYEKIKKLKNLIKKYLKDIGYFDSNISYSAETTNNSTKLNFAIYLGKPTLIKELNIQTKYEWVRDYVQDKLAKLNGVLFNLQEVKKTLDSIKDDLFDLGFYKVNYTLNHRSKSNLAFLYVNIDSGEQFFFKIKRNKIISKRQLDDFVRDVFSKYKKNYSDKKFEEELVKLLSERAYLNPSIVVKSRSYKRDKVDLILKVVELTLRRKTRVNNVYFRGNYFFSETYLKDQFYKHSFDLSSSRYIDLVYYDYFVELIRKKYLENGFVQIDVRKPIFYFNKDKSIVDIVFNVKEGVRTFLEDFSIDGLTMDELDDISKKLTNKSGFPFNPLKIEEDIYKSLEAVREKGYFSATIKSLNQDDIIKYSPDNSSVEVKISILKGKKINLKNIYYVGISKTKQKLLEREIKFKPGQIITPSKLNEIRSQLDGLGIFESVNVIPLVDDSAKSATDVAISVKEKEYTSIELIPGFRSDIGAKLAASYNVMNVFGLNHSFSSKIQLNRRFDTSFFDQRRSLENRKPVEGFINATYNYRNFFTQNIDLDINGTYSKRRFYAFDAKILRGSTTFNYNISKSTFTSLRLQLENIEQTDATDPSDAGKFKVGSLTPSFTFDKRNRRVNPSEGAIYNLSLEMAQPDFGSDENIQYYKAITRNNFYIPLNNGAIAIYTALGVQKNLAGGENPIPDIKSFRLSGTDLVRGYAFDEINRLYTDSTIINDVDITNRLYMANIKIEPRYFINDSMVLGIFYDAGRLYYNEINDLSMRSSVGLSFKYITPVGSLDIDYGVKTLRKRNPDGILDSPGRLHVSIGFF